MPNLTFVVFIGHTFLQNPPGVPAMVVCYVYSLLHRRTTLVIDWHNYGFTIMSLALGADHPLVGIAKRIEEFVGRRVGSAFCVSNAMKAGIFLCTFLMTTYTRLFLDTLLNLKKL